MELSLELIFSPNFLKVNYEPYMTVPQSKSHTVYINPLVKYSNNIITSAPKENIYTQLTAIKGIGPWTVHYALLRGFGWLDVSAASTTPYRLGMS